jgi:hypothetical protein
MDESMKGTYQVRYSAELGRVVAQGNESAIRVKRLMYVHRNNPRRLTRRAIQSIMTVMVAMMRIMSLFKSLVGWTPVMIPA